MPFAFEFAPRLYEQARRNAKLTGHGDEVRFVRFEEPDKRGEYRGLADAAAELVCPDSGQVDEPTGPACVTKRCRKGGKGKCMSIDWRIRVQRLTISRRVGGVNWPRS